MVTNNIAYNAGNFVCTDQYVVNTPGRLIMSYDRELPHNQFHGGTIFMILLLILSGLRIISHLELEKI